MLDKLTCNRYLGMKLSCLYCQKLSLTISFHVNISMIVTVTSSKNPLWPPPEKWLEEPSLWIIDAYTKSTIPQLISIKTIIYIFIYIYIYIYHQSICLDPNAEEIHRKIKTTLYLVPVSSV